MLGIVLNLILVSLAVLALAAGTSFYVQEKEAGYVRGYTHLFSIAVFFICAGYGIMGFLPYVKYAFIPRLVGLYGIDVFLLMELSFLTMELKQKPGIRGVIIGIFALYVLLDLIIFGRPSALNYVRYDFHTAYENKITGAFFFHYSFIIVICLVLLYHGIKWYKSQKNKRDRIFVVEIILANFVLLFAALPDMFNLPFAKKYPAFFYSLAFSIVYFSYWMAIRYHMTFTPTVKNVSQEIFYSIDVPVLIFDLEGAVSLFNPAAEEKCAIKDGRKATIRSLFTLSDVETLRLLSKARRGISEKLETKIKSNQKPCSIHCTIRMDYTGEPFCIIGTVVVKDIQNIEETEK